MQHKSQKRFKSQLFKKSERDFWKNLHINIDAICDGWEEKYSVDLKKYLKWFSEKELREFLLVYKINNSRKSCQECFLENPRFAIDFLCIVLFYQTNPKAISRLFNIEIVDNVINKTEVIKRLFLEHSLENTQYIFLQIMRQKLGKGNYKYGFNSDISKNEFIKFGDAMELLSRHLKKCDKQNKTYHYRLGFRDTNEWIFLLLKETADIIYPAIPDNTRVLRGSYILITILLNEKALEINTKSKKEAYEIRNYLSWKIDNELLYSKKISLYNPTTFFEEIKKEIDTKNELILIDIDFKSSKINSMLKVSDQHHKNDIFIQLKTLKDKDIISLNDFSEMRSMSFIYKGISFKIFVEENKWGQIRLNFIDRGKPKIEVQNFKLDFEHKFNVPLDVHLKNTNANVDLKRLTRKILDKTTIDATLPKEAEDVLLDLIGLKIISKPTKTSKRRCTNATCRKITWIKGDCPICGNSLQIEGNYIDISLNIKGLYEFLYLLIRSTKIFSIKRTKKQIDSSSFQLIDLIDRKGNPLSIYISLSNVSEKIIKHFQETGFPLLIILVRYKEALYKDIKDKGFECLDIADLYVNRNDETLLSNELEQLVQNQKNLWQKRIIEKGYKSYLSLTNKRLNYNDQDFEKDIFNVFHELFLIGDRLGGKFAGVPAPDGVVSIQNYNTPLKRYCFAWDCKYSVSQSGYKLADPPTKHRKYINSLKKNNKIILYGDLSTYAIISQNMDMNAYQNFYLKLTKGFRWKGNVIFIEEKMILKIYKLYKENEEIIQNAPSIFYTKVYNLFKKIPFRDSKPYKIISETKLKSFVNELEKAFASKKIKFTFERSEF